MDNLNNLSQSMSGASGMLHNTFEDYSPEEPSGLSGDQSIFGLDDTWAYAAYDGDDQGDAKRRRIARACDSCRRKKIKCDAKMPRCTHCESFKTQCVFTHIEKKRNPPKGAKYIEGLENRLGRMEHLLRLSGLLTEDDEEGADLGTLEQRLAQQINSNRDSPRSNADPPRPDSKQGEGATSSPQTVQAGQSLRSKTSSPRMPHGEQKVKTEEKDKDKETTVDDLADMMWCSLVTNNQGETRFIGSSSGFSIFSPKGVQWVNEKTGDQSFTSMISALSQDDNKWYPWREEVFGDIFARRVFQPLPPQDECMSLIDEFFESFNTMFPLFHEPTFRHLVSMQYSDDPYDGSGWWASLNVALAIAHRIRRLKSQSDTCPPEDSVSWQFFKNALAVLSELTLRNTDLLSVQALIGMCLFLQGSPNPQPSFYLIGAALRLAHSIGLHKHGSGFGLNSAEVEQRKRVFWIAYMIDKDICLRSGRPPAQDDDDWNVDLPSEDPEDGFGTVPLADGTKTNLFHTLCRFAVISAKVYNKLYSVRAARQSDGELLATIGELDTELEAWKDSIPLDFRPEHELTALPPHLVIHIVILHFAYYNCLTTIHRRSVHHGYWTSRLSDFATQGLNVKPLNPRVFSSAALCVSAARTSVHLIKYIPPGDYAFVWLILYYPVSALVTLFANILQNPQDARARADLKLIRAVVAFLETIANEDKTGSLQKMFMVCGEFERIAILVLQKAEQEMTTRQKRKQDREREKIAKRREDPIEIPQPIRNSGEISRNSASFLPQQPQQQRFQQSMNLQQQQQRNLNGADSMSKMFGSTPVNNIWSTPNPITGMTVPQLSSANGQVPTDISVFDFTRSLELPDNMSWPQFQQGNSAIPQFGAASQFPPQFGGGANATQSYNDDFLTMPGAQQVQQTQQSSNKSATEASSPDYGTPSYMNFGGTNGQSSFQQPMIPQELFNAPMTFEWDWAEMMNMTGVTPGLNFGGGVFGSGDDDTLNGEVKGGRPA